MARFDSYIFCMTSFLACRTETVFLLVFAIVMYRMWTSSKDFSDQFTDLKNLICAHVYKHLENYREFLKSLKHSKDFI